MRIVKPIGRAEPGEPDRSARRVHVRAEKPQWLREWIEDQGHYVLLSCGHRENMNDRATLIIARISGVYIVCEKCRDLAAVVKHMKFTEYAQIPAKAETDEPLF